MGSLRPILAPACDPSYTEPENIGQTSRVTQTVVIMAVNGDRTGTEEKSKVGIIKKVFSGKILSCTNGRQQAALSEEDLDYIARHTSISRDQVEAQFQKFIRIHPDGNISKRSFSEMMQECYPGADTEKLSRHIWRMYDTNKDGHIDFKEFMIVLYVMSNGSPEENLRQIFRVFDINNDGRISATELKRIVKDLFHLLNEGDAEAASQEILVKSAFSEMDEDGDGEITQEEFIKACMEQKKFSTMLTLKIINVFLADSAARDAKGEADLEAKKKSQQNSDKDRAKTSNKKKSTDGLDSLDTGRDRYTMQEAPFSDDVMRKKGPPVRQCTSASSVDTRSRQEPPRRGGSCRADTMEANRKMMEPMVVSAHKLQIENKKQQGGDRTPNTERKSSVREGCGLAGPGVQESAGGGVSRSHSGSASGNQRRNDGNGSHFVPAVAEPRAVRGQQGPPVAPRGQVVINKGGRPQAGPVVPSCNPTTAGRAPQPRAGSYKDVTRDFPNQ